MPNPLYRSIQTCLALVLLLACAPTCKAGVPVPLPGDTPVDPAKLCVENPAVISTNGTWRFGLTHGAMIDGQFVHQAITASSSESGHPATDAVDGKADTRWCAEGDSMPQWWQVDLGVLEQVEGINLSFELENGRYKYRVDAGPDEAHLKPVSDQTQPAGAGDQKLEWPATPARIVRVTITSATDADGNRKWASIREAGVAIVRDGEKMVWSPRGKEQANPDADDFAATSFDDSNWHDIPVPSNWEILGYSPPTYFGPDSAVGLYRRWIDIPASFAGKKVIWHFDGVTDSAEIWVNGQRMGYHEGGFTAFDIDLSDKLRPGEKNLLAVRVCKTTPTVDLDTGDYWLLGGIHRDSHLVALPKDHVAELTVVTTLDEKYTNARLLADAVVEAQPGHAWDAAAKLFKADGTPVDVNLSVTQKPAAQGPNNLHIEANVQAPALWSAEKPNLYYLLITLAEQGKPIETIQQRFGFRQVEIKQGQLLWNGAPIKCTGTCRHEEWAALGHALTEHEWQTDVAMMKAANINAVRTSHYNHAERFLELCDEKGIYVLDEIPACWVSNKDPKLKDAFVQHAVETLARDKNKPCVLAWSCGNESGWGPNFKAMVDYVAANDPTRPRFVSEQNKNRDPNLSISDHHYPGDSDLKKITTTDPGPSVITEGPHIFYNIGHQAYDYGLNDLWGEALAAQWDRVWPSKPLFGAFIWEWQDQGLADKSPDKTGVDANGLRRENSKGIVTGYRVPKPEYYHVKMVYSPVTTDQREVDIDGKNWTARFSNRYAFTDLSELTCKTESMTTVDVDRVIYTGGVKLSCAPGASATVSVPATPDADTLRVSFVNPAGVEVYAVRLHVPGAPVPQPPMPVDRGRNDLLSDAYFVPTLNLGELRVDDGDFLNKNDAPWIQSRQPPVLTHRSVQRGPTADRGECISVTAEVTLVEAPNQVLGQLTYDFTSHPDNTIDCNYRLKWSALDMQAWEFGLKFKLPGDYQYSWYRKGQWTEYPAGHIGANQGSASHEDRSFSSTKRDTIWAAITRRSDGLVLQATDAPLHTRCNYDNGVTTFFASSAVAVDRDFSSGYVDSTRITFRQGHTYEGSFRAWLTKGTAGK
jgi:beta-galactosidase